MNIRKAMPEDYPKLVEFWNKNSGWDVINQDLWEDRFINAPFGPSVVMICENKSKIMAQLIFVLLTVELGGNTISACRPFAAVASKSQKLLSGFKYIIRLFHSGVKQLRHEGYDLLLMIPDPRWRHLLKFFGTTDIWFPLYKLNLLSDNIKKCETDLNSGSIDLNDHAIDDLWIKVYNRKPFMITRDRVCLRWKNSHRNYKPIGVFNNDQLIAVYTYLEKSTDRQIQICDLLMDPNSSSKTILSEISHFLTKTYIGDERFCKVVILATRALEPILFDVGYVPDKYNFLFSIKRLNKKLPEEVINISNWYLSAND